MDMLDKLDNSLVMSRRYETPGLKLVVSRNRNGLPLRGKSIFADVNVSYCFPSSHLGSLLQSPLIPLPRPLPQSVLGDSPLVPIACSGEPKHHTILIISVFPSPLLDEEHLEMRDILFLSSQQLQYRDWNRASA